VPTVCGRRAVGARSSRSPMLVDRSLFSSNGDKLNRQIQELERLVTRRKQRIALTSNRQKFQFCKTKNSATTEASTANPSAFLPGLLAVASLPAVLLEGLPRAFFAKGSVCTATFLTGFDSQTEFVVTHSKQKAATFLTGSRFARQASGLKPKTQEPARRGGLARVMLAARGLGFESGADLRAGEVEEQKTCDCDADRSLDDAARGRVEQVSQHLSANDGDGEPPSPDLAFEPTRGSNRKCGAEQQEQESDDRSVWRKFAMSGRIENPYVVEIGARPAQAGPRKRRDDRAEYEENSHGRQTARRVCRQMAGRRIHALTIRDERAFGAEGCAVEQAKSRSLELRPAPLKTRGKAKTRGTPLGMTVVGCSVKAALVLRCHRLREPN